MKGGEKKEEKKEEEEEEEEEEEWKQRSSFSVSTFSPAPPRPLQYYLKA